MIVLGVFLGVVWLGWVEVGGWVVTECLLGGAKRVWRNKEERLAATLFISSKKALEGGLEGQIEEERATALL